MEEWNYWQCVMQGRLSRRRSLAVAGSGLTAAFLAACGGGGKGTQEAAPKEAPKVSTDDTSAQAVRGGTLTFVATDNPPNLDPYRTGSFQASTFASFIYNRLLKLRTGPDHDPGLFEVSPDLAESHEMLDGGLRYVFKIRPDAKMPNDPRVNGRALDAQDVKFTWDRFNTIPSPNKTLLGGVDAMEFPDDRTVVVKMKEPSADLLQLLSDSSIFWVQPREIGEGKIDPSTNPVGAGPWLNKDFQRGVKWHFARNPNYFIKDRPFLDEYVIAVIPEYANRRAQFMAKNLDFFDPTNEDAPKVRREALDAQFTANNPTTSLHFYAFESVQPGSPSPFKDERVRRALSMASDRDGLLASVWGGDTLKAAGLPFTYRWHNILPAGFTKWWLDPKSPEMGEAAKWYKYDIGEAKKLMEAAGYKDGFEAEYHYSNNIYGQAFNDAAEAVVAMAQAVGIKPRVMVEDYASRYFPETFIKGNFKGYANMLQTQFSGVGDYLRAMYLPAGSRNHRKVEIPQLTDMINKQQGQFDENRRKTLIHDIQRYASNKMYYVPLVRNASETFTFAWPWVMNFRAFRTIAYGYGTEREIHYWRKPA